MVSPINFSRDTAEMISAKTPPGESTLASQFEALRCSISHYVIEFNGVVIAKAFADETRATIERLAPDCNYCIRIWAVSDNLRGRSPSRVLRFKTPRKLGVKNVAGSASEKAIIEYWAERPLDQWMAWLGLQIPHGMQPILTDDRIDRDPADFVVTQTIKPTGTDASLSLSSRPKTSLSKPLSRSSSPASIKMSRRDESAASLPSTSASGSGSGSGSGMTSSAFTLNPAASKSPATSNSDRKQDDTAKPLSTGKLLKERTIEAIHLLMGSTGKRSQISSPLESAPPRSPGDPIDRSKLVAEYRQVLSQRQYLESTLATLTQTLTDEENQLFQQLKALKETKKLADERRAEIRARTSQLEETRRQSETARAKLERDLQDLERDIDRYRTQCTDLQTECGTLSSQIGMLQQAMSDNEKTHADQIHTVEQQIAQASQEVEAATRERDLQKQLVDNLVAENLKRQSFLDKIERETRLLGIESPELRDQESHLDEQIRQLRATYLELKEEQEAVQNGLREESRMKLSLLQQLSKAKRQVEDRQHAAIEAAINADLMSSLPSPPHPAAQPPLS
eukprot:jgi/Hompol1/4907/HPOL_002086-RA